MLTYVIKYTIIYAICARVKITQPLICACKYGAVFADFRGSAVIDCIHRALRQRLIKFSG